MYKIQVISTLILVAVAVLATIRVSGQSPAVADKAIYLAEVTDLLKVQWPANRTLNIVCHGHSVPAGYFVTPIVDTFNAYPHLLHQALKARYPFAVINIIVSSIGGEGSASGTRRFEADVLSHRPDIVTIDYALNDRGGNLAEVRANWTKMITAAKTSGCKVILLTPTADQRSELLNPADPLALHAQQIRELAGEHGVALVDSYAAFQQYVRDGGELIDLMSQVNHPNRKGHDLVVTKLLEWFPE
jgi:lysophospholipase L1-like esterase